MAYLFFLQNTELDQALN